MIQGIFSTTTKAVDASVITATGLLTSLTNSLSGDVSMAVADTYYDGPSVAQGTAGTWFVSGTVTLDDETNAAVYNVKLWDGTTLIASSSVTINAAQYYATISLSGVITSPAGNLRISCKELFQVTGNIKATSKDTTAKASTITAVRIA